MDEIHFLESYPFKSPHPALVDVGAHHGQFSLAFARKGWRVLALEPERVNRTRLVQHLRAYTNVVCVPKAASNVSGERVPFYVSDEHFGIHSLRPWHATHKRAYDVETVRLDDLLRDQHWTHVTFLKIDIEGADFLALQGFTLEVYRPELIMMEFMDERTSTAFGYTHHDAARYLRARGYSTFVSEWTAITQYAREGVQDEASTTWLGCAPYPLDHAPAWGNLLAVPSDNAGAFLSAVQRGIERYRARTRYQQIAERIPGSRAAYRFVKTILRRVARGSTGP